RAATPVSTSSTGERVERGLCPRWLTIVVMRVAIVGMHRSATLLLALFLAGCATNAIRIVKLAESLATAHSVGEARGFRSLVYTHGAPAPQDAPLTIFI